MKTLIIALIIALAALQYKLWLGDGGLLESFHLSNKLAIQEQENQKITARNRAVEADIAELNSGEQALEEQARHELGMVKEGEVYYQFVD